MVLKGPINIEVCMRLLFSLTALVMLGAAAPPTAPAATPLPVHIGGRVVPEADGALGFGWPGVYFESRFRGTGVRVRFDAPAEHMRLLIDGEEKAIVKRPGRGELAFDDLAAGEHVVRLEKLTESQTGGGRFLGFFASDDGAPLPPRPRARQIEFIGDSFTVGYGNTSAERACSERQVHDTTDTQQAFGPLLARRLDADYRINAYSGFGVVRNYGGSSPGLSLPAIYDRLKPDQPGQIERADARWRPQIIVVNLGTNDFSTPLKPGEAWRDGDALKAAYRQRYVAFVRELRARQPQARFILMGSDLFFAEVERVAAALAGEARISTLRFTGLDYGGCHSHPSLADDRKLAALLEQAIGAF
jgi:lysophospholipase L1-like esterase